MIRPTAAFLALCAAAVLASEGRAGPLNPPAGPIAPTGKTLTEVEPRTPISAATTPGDADSTFKITQPGSYYLTGNLSGESAKRGIEVAANDVTIDLCGFTMIGVAGSLEAIGDVSILASVAVKNGTVSGWGAGGVILDNSRNCLVADVLVRNVVGVGIRVLFNSIISRCTIDETGGAGPSVAGIQAQCCTVIESCHIDVFSSGTPDGILVTDGCIIRNCVINNIGGFGIRATSNTNTIEGCVMLFTNAGGVSVPTGCTVRNCNITNAGVGISVSGSDNRIERNTVRASTTGLGVSGAGNIVFGNTLSGNTTNFDIAAGNVGLFMNAATGGAFTGNAGGVSPGSTDDNTNYAY